MNFMPGTASFSMLLVFVIVMLIAAMFLYIGGFWPAAMFLLATAEMSNRERSGNNDGKADQ